MKKLFIYCLVPFAYCFISFAISAQPKPEFRGVWVATVDNIDWPSSKNLSSEAQKNEFIKLLDMHNLGVSGLQELKDCHQALITTPYNLC